MDFSTLKSLSIPEGVVTKITNANNIVIWKAVTSRIPEEYQEVEYIRADKNAQIYIDLGFSYNKGATVEMGQYIVDANTTYIFGAAENNGALRCMFSSPYSNGVTIYGSGSSGHISIATNFATAAYNKIKATFKTSGFKAINTTTGYVSTAALSLIEYTMTNKLYLFAQNYNGSPRYGGVRQLSYFKYYDKDDVLICDLVPCYRKSDKVSGMYDVVRKVFLTNALNNDKAFGVGPNVNGPTILTYTNLIETAVGDDGKTYGTYGYKDGMRWSSSGETETGDSKGRLSGWMPYEKGSVYRFKNFYMQEGYVHGAYVIYKKTDGTINTIVTPLSGDSNFIVDMTNDLCTFLANVDNVTAFRISGFLGDSPPIVTKNEEII